MENKYGYVDGKYYLEYIEDVKQLKKEGKYKESVNLLLKLVDAIEKESKAKDIGVAPWYYEQLSIIYKKLNDKEAEINILERFSKQKHARGVKPKKLLDKLLKLKTIK